MELNPVSFKPEWMISKNSDPHKGRVYFIEEGSVEVWKEGIRVGGATLGPGQFVGEMGVISDEPRSAMVRAGKNGMNGFCLTEEQPGEFLEFFTEVCHTSTAQLVIQLVERLRATTKELVSVRQELTTEKRRTTTGLGHATN